MNLVCDDSSVKSSTPLHVLSPATVKLRAIQRSNYFDTSNLKHGRGKKNSVWFICCDWERFIWGKYFWYISVMWTIKKWLIQQIKNKVNVLLRWKYYLTISSEKVYVSEEQQLTWLRQLAATGLHHEYWWYFPEFHSKHHHWWNWFLQLVGKLVRFFSILLEMKFVISLHESSTNSKSQIQSVE